MQITNAYNSNIITITRNSSATAGNASTTANSAQFNSALINEMPVNQPSFIDEATAMRYEISELLQQFSEWMRVAGEVRRMEFLYNILLKESHETSDLFGKIMDIARRIMRNEDVTLEEMRFLAEQNPRLLYFVLMLKEDTAQPSGTERRRDRERRKKDRRSMSRRRDYMSRGIDQPERRVIERNHYTVPRELVKQINSLIVDKSLKKSYDIGANGRKNLSLSINAVVTNPHDVAM